MDLHFISQQDGSRRVGSEDRRLIRSHVMKGRNTGKSRPTQLATPTRRTLLRFDCLGCSDAQVARRVHSCACYMMTLDMTRPIWNDLAMVSVPYQLDRRLRGLIHECFVVASHSLYPLRFCASDNSMISAWIQFVFQDEAYLHCSLAMTASYTDYFVGHTRVSPRALGYLAKAYALVNQKLSGTEATSTTTIAAVTSLVIYQRIHHLQSVGMIHFEGLQRIILLRGGMTELAQESQALAQKPWRLDIELALQDGSPIRFIGEDAPPCIFPASVPWKERQATKPPKLSLHQRRTDLGAIAVEIESFAELLNDIREDNKLGQLNFAQHVQHLLHRLLHFAPLLGAKKLTIVDNLLHLALVAFMTTLLHEYGRQHSRYDLLGQLFKEELQRSVPVSIWEEEFMLWASFVAGISVLEAHDDGWLLKVVHTRCVVLGLRSWEQVHKTLRAFAWIGSLHNNAGKRLHDAVCQANDTSQPPHTPTLSQHLRSSVAKLPGTLSVSRERSPI